MAPTVQLGRITALALRGPKSSTISSTVTSERFAASTASFCTPTMPSMSTLPARSALSAWITATSGRIAGTAASRSPGERTGDVPDVAVHLRQVDSDIAAKDRKRQPGRAGLVGVGHGGVRMLLDRDRRPPAVLVGIAEPMQRADAGIADPGEYELVGAAHADELIVNEVGGHSDQGQVAAALADDLVSRRKRDEMGESLHGHRIAIA